MKLDKNYFYIIIGLFLVSAFAYQACSESLILKVDCDECYNDEPEMSDLTIKVSISTENDSVPIIIYRGKPEIGNIMRIDTLTTSEASFQLTVNNYYSVEAKYKDGARTIIAVDGKNMDTKKVTDYCDQECFVVTGKELDVRLK